MVGEDGGAAWARELGTEGLEGRGDGRSQSHSGHRTRARYQLHHAHHTWGTEDAGARGRHS